MMFSNTIATRWWENHERMPQTGVCDLWHREYQWALIYRLEVWNITLRVRIV